MNIAVVAAGCNLTAFLRQDGAWFVATAIAQDRVVALLILVGNRARRIARAIMSHASVAVGRAPEPAAELVERRHRNSHRDLGT
jgi:uncharacterized protein GlcG (DUF336 family)